MKIRKVYRVPVLCGIKLDENQNVVFSWNNDDESDVIHLLRYGSGEYNEDGVRYTYGYSYNSAASNSDRRIVRNYLKGLNGTDFIFDENVEEFVDSALYNFDSRFSISNFSVIVSTQSSFEKSLVNLMRNRLTQFFNPEYQELTTFELVKSTYVDVEFDVEKAKKCLLSAGYSQKSSEYEIQFLLDKFQSLKASGELFQMKRFTPVAIRSGFSSFLKFQSKEEEDLYRQLQGVNVLIFDDFITSGSTIKEMIRCLRSIHNENQLTAFALIKQHWSFKN